MKHRAAPKTRKSFRTAAIAALVTAGIGSAGIWYLAQESTLISGAKYVVRHMDGRLEIVEISGSLLSNIRVKALKYTDKFGTVAINDAEMKWRPARLLLGQVAVGAMTANTVSVSLLKTDEERKPPESLRAPMSFAVTDFRIGTLTVRQDESIHEVRDIHAAFSGNRKRLAGEVKSLATQWGHLKGELKVGANHPFDLDGAISLTSLEQDVYKVKVGLGGSLMNAEATVDAKGRDADATAKLAVAPYDKQPLTFLEFAAKNFDPHAWSAGAPTAALGGHGRIVTDANRNLTGGIVLDNTKPGTIDEKKLPFAQLAANVEGNAERLAFPQVKLDLASAGVFSGGGEWRDGALDLKLRTQRLDLRGLQKRLHKTQLAGELALGGDAETQRVRLNLAQGAYRVRLGAALSDGVVKISEAYAQARSAQLSGRGAVALNGQKTFTVNGQLRDFDPSQFGAYPAQRINSRFAFKGSLNPVIQVAADVSVSESTLFGLPATARGTFRSTRGDRPDVAVNLSLSVGRTHATAKGTMRDPANMESMDLNLTLAGASLEELYKIAKVPLPPSPPYRIQGRLLHSGKVWELRQFAGTVGESDLSGTFVVDRGPSPQFMKANLTSNRLDLADLHGFIGAEKTPGGKVAVPDPNRVLPTSPYNLEKLKAADADIHFRGKRVVTEKLPVDNMNARLIIKGGIARLAPLDFGVAGGKLISDITLDGRNPVIASRADMRIDSVQLGQLMPKLESAKNSIGEIDGRVRLTARGNSIAAMLGSANGDTVVAMGEGEFSDLMLRLSNLDLANTLLVLMRGDKTIRMRCGVAELAFENGVMRPRQFVIDTAHTTLYGEGSANFADETLDLKLVAKAKDASLMSLRGPIEVRGTFAKPSPMPDMTNLALRGAAAIALGVLMPPLAVLPFVQLGSKQEVHCDPLLQTARQKIEAPRVATVGR